MDKEQDLEDLEQKQEVVLKIIEENQSSHFSFDYIFNTVAAKTTSRGTFDRRVISDTTNEAEDIAFMRVNDSVSPKHLPQFALV